MFLACLFAVRQKMRFSAILLAFFAFWFVKPETDSQVAEPAIELETLVADDPDQVKFKSKSAGLDLVNKQRKTRSLGPLVFDPGLNEIGRASCRERV